MLQILRNKEVVLLPPLPETMPNISEKSVWVRLPLFEGGRTQWAELTVRNQNYSLELEWPNGSACITDEDLAGLVSDPHLWLNEFTRSLVLTSRTAESVYKVDLLTSEVKVFMQLERGPDGNLDHDFRFIATTTAPGSVLLLLFERGILAINRNGEILWLTRLELTDAWFLKSDNNVVWFECIFPGDWRGYTRGVHLVNGDLVEEDSENNSR